MLSPKAARDKEFDVSNTEHCPNEQEKPKPEQFFRPDEADRIARARAWLRIARGKSPAANLQGQHKDEGR
jgi:hypothetical protein